MNTSPVAGEDVYAFLELFLSRFPQYADLPFHLAAESYGGTYAPNIASVIYRENKALAASAALAPVPGVRHINLESVILSYAIPHVMSTSPAPRPSDPVKLDKLTQLHMTEHYLTQCSWILEHIRAPALSEIALKCGGPEEDGLADHRALLRFLSTALSSHHLDMLHATATPSKLKIQAWSRREGCIRETANDFCQPIDAASHDWVSRQAFLA